MSLTLLASNNASTVLASSINASATTLTVNTGAGSLFPSPVAGTSFFKLTLIDAATGQLTEIVHVTARTGDVMTIERAQEGTSARVWSANDIAANMMTAGTLSYILGSFQPLDATLTALALLTGSADKLPYFNGDDTAALTTLTAFAREILAQTDAAGIISKLGLGSAATRSVGTGTDQIPDMNAWTGSYGANESAGTWYKMPNGIIVQEGIFTSVGTGQVAVPLKIPFTSRILSFSATKNQGFFTPIISPKNGSLSEFWLGSTNGSGSWSNGDQIHWRLEGI